MSPLSAPSAASKAGGSVTSVVDNAVRTPLGWAHLSARQLLVRPSELTSLALKSPSKPHLEARPICEDQANS
jgi:hypothetical protein